MMDVIKARLQKIKLKHVLLAAVGLGWFLFVALSTYVVLKLVHF